MTILTVDQVISATGAFAAVLAAAWAWWSARVAQQQLDLLKQNIAMVTDADAMEKILPVWYIRRMSTDSWGFGLLLTSGDVLAIERIEGVSSDKAWIEVILKPKHDGLPKELFGTPILYAPTDRLVASVRVEQISAAFEIETS
jgi:hypothetical protein